MAVDLAVCLWPHPGPLEKALDDAARAGFARIDVARPPSFAETFRDLCDARGLEVSGVPLFIADDQLGFEFRGRGEFDETVRFLARQIDDAAAVGARTVYLGAPEPRWRYFRAGRLLRLAEGLATLAEVAKQREVTICLAPQPWTLLKTTAQTLGFLADLPDIRVMAGHSNEDLAGAIRAAGPRLGYVQLIGGAALPDPGLDVTISILVERQPDPVAAWTKAREQVRTS